MLRNFNVLQPPYIRVDATVTANAVVNGKKTISDRKLDYYVAPSPKKIATYIVNQIFGSELVTQTDGLDIRWLMPSLKEALELGIYQKESFIYIHKFNNKIYLECLKKTDLVDVVQNWDVVSGATIVQEFYDDEECYLLKRIVTIDNGSSLVEFKAFIETSSGEEQVSIAKFNEVFNTEYIPKYVLPYEVLINIDLGQDFFCNSRHIINAEINVLNTLVEEINKTKTKIVTSQHYSTGDITMAWMPGSMTKPVDTLGTNVMRDYFTLLPGDKDHQFFEYLQGDIRYESYIETFKFYDYQIIQMAGLSPASFGYEKDAYMNTTNIDLSKNNSEMTIEAIKSQLQPQIDKLIQNIIMAQTSLQIGVNVLPGDLQWDFGATEAFDDVKKLKLMQQIQGVGTIPTRQKMQILAPIINKLIDEDVNEKDVEALLNNFNEDQKMSIEFGEV